MTGWLLPLVASAFWAGVLSWPVVHRALGSAGALVMGLGLLATAVATASTERPRPGVLEAAGLAGGRRDRVAAAVAPEPGPVPRAPPGVALLAAALSFVALGAGWAGLHEERIRGSPLNRLGPAWVVVEGSLDTDPSPGRFGWSAELRASAVQRNLPEAPGEPHRAIHERLWLEGSGSLPRARRGDRLEVTGRLLVQDDGDFATFLLHRGISVILEADRARRVGPSANLLVRAAQAARASLLGEVRALFGAREAGLLMGLALGDTLGLDPGDEEHFRATGLGHLLAVSGENVAMVLAPILGLALLLRLSAVGRFLLGGGAVLFFVVLTGAEPSVLRAGVMAGLALAGALLGRPRSTGSILAGAVLVLLVVDPFLVYSLGFQLSVAATAGIVALAGPLAARLRFLPRPLAIATATTLAAQAAVSPILLDQFHQVPWVTIVANVLAFPAVAPALLLGLAAAGVGLLFGPVGALLALVAAVPIRYLEVLADQMASAPLPSVTSKGDLPVLLGGMAAVAALAWWLRSGRRLPRSALVGGILVLTLFVWSTALRAGPPSGLVVHFFDVGQGDAALVRSPGGATLLIDGGPDPELTATKLAALGIKRLDAVVATHPHLDHFVGLPAVLARYPVGVVLDSGCRVPETRSAPYREFLRAVEREGVPEKHPREGDTWTVGDLTLRFLSPDRCWHGTNSDPNNDSLVILLTYREDSVLFANEPEMDAQKAMLENHEPLTAQVLNVPHHGADTSWLPFLQAVHEEVAVISVGQPNSYGHPTPHLLHELRTTGPAILRTDRCGDVTVAFSSAGLAVDTERCPGLLLQSSG